MTRTTRHSVKRKFGGTFDEKGEFKPTHTPVPHRYKCSCNPNGFVAGQAINHYLFCPFHKRNIEVFLNEESTLVQFVVLILVCSLLAASCLGFIHAINAL